MSSPIAILSPHLDDAALSCWHVLAGAHDVLVVNLFAGVPAASTPVGWWDVLSGYADPQSTVFARLAEDRAALAMADREPLNLGFLDHQYRHGDQAQRPLVDALLDALPWGVALYAPAALPSPVYDAGPAGAGGGSHPDHVAARSAALELRARGFPLTLYADLPHASARGWPAWVTTDGGAHGVTTDAGAHGHDDVDRLWENALDQTGTTPEHRPPEVTRLSPSEFTRKVEAIRLYASQAPMLERAFRGLLGDPALLGYEVAWELRGDPTPVPSASDRARPAPTRGNPQ